MRSNVSFGVAQMLFGEVLDRLRLGQASLVETLDEYEPDWPLFNAAYDAHFRVRAVGRSVLEQYPVLERGREEEYRALLKFMSPDVDAQRRVGQYPGVMRVSLFVADRLHVIAKVLKALRRGQGVDINGPACFVRFETPCAVDPVYR